MLNHYVWSESPSLGRDRPSMTAGWILLATALIAGKAHGLEDTLTTAEIRTLKNAVTVVQYQPQILELVKQCSADVLQDLPPVVADGDEKSLELLLQQKLKITSAELIKLLQENEHFANLTNAAVVGTPECNDREAILDLTEQFSNNYTALELSDPLEPWQRHFVAQSSSAAMDPAHLKDLINNSYSMVLVTIQPKSKLTAMQQANFLHIDDKSTYVFEVQQGWKAIAARYQGLHINISPDNYQQQPKRWLLLLDARLHPKTALHGAQLQQALKLLGTPDWTFNMQGDLLRAAK
jgi:hypothetical protein